MEIDITSLANEDARVGMISGMVAFDKGALPGERVMVLVSKVGKNFAEANLPRILPASSDRISPSCILTPDRGSIEINRRG